MIRNLVRGLGPLLVSAAMLSPALAQGVPTVDLTSIAKRTYEALRRDPKFARKGADKYGIPNTFNGWMAELLDAIEARPGTTIITAWSAPPVFSEETNALVSKGTIELPGKQWQQQLPGSCNLVANVVYDEAFAPRSYVYDTSPNPYWVCGDRILGTRGRFPQSLSLVLWGAGRKIEWPIGLEWFDEAIPPIMNKIIELKGNNETPSKAREVLAEVIKAAIKTRKVSIAHTRWLVIEARERAWWRLDQQETIANEVAGIFPDEAGGNEATASGEV